MGTSAFAETSKLKRRVLALEKELQEIYLKCRKKVEDLEQWQFVVLFGQEFGEFGNNNANK